MPNPRHPFHVYTKDGKFVGSAQTKQGAQTVRDRLDNKYGGYNHFVKPNPNPNVGGDLAEIPDLQGKEPRATVRTRQNTVESGTLPDPGRTQADKTRLVNKSRERFNQKAANYLMKKALGWPSDEQVKERIPMPNDDAAIKDKPDTFPGKMVRKAKDLGLTTKDYGRENAELTRVGLMGSKEPKMKVLPPGGNPTAPTRGTTPEDYHEFIGQGPKSATDLGEKEPGATKAQAEFKRSVPEMNREWNAAHPKPATAGADLGEKEPGATLGQKVRARGIAASLREGRSSVSSESSTGHPVETDLHTDTASRPAGGPWTPKDAVATGSGPDAGATRLAGGGKDLGRVTAKYARGDSPAGEQPGLLQTAKKRALKGAPIAGSEAEVAASASKKMSLSQSLKAKFGGSRGGGGQGEVERLKGESSLADTQNEVEKSRKDYKPLPIVPEGF